MSALAKTPTGSNPTTFGTRLQALRQRRGWSQRQLGEAIFFSREYVSLVERGLRPPNPAFVARAEQVLNAGGTLSRLHAQLDLQRARDAQRRASTRRVTPSRGKIVAAAKRLRAAAPDERADEPSQAWWSAFDDLHRVLRDQLNPVDEETRIADLEQRRADLTADAGRRNDWAKVASTAAVSVADAGALLHQPLRHDLLDRVEAVARHFALLAEQALTMLGHVERAHEWHELAETVGEPPAPVLRSEGQVKQPARVDQAGADEADAKRCAGSARPSARRFGTATGDRYASLCLHRPPRMQRPRYCGSSRRRIRHGRSPPRRQAAGTA